jgi:hypothetical protein
MEMFFLVVEKTSGNSTISLPKLFRFSVFFLWRILIVFLSHGRGKELISMGAKKEQYSMLELSEITSPGVIEIRGLVPRM